MNFFICLIFAVVFLKDFYFLKLKLFMIWLSQTLEIEEE